MKICPTLAVENRGLGGKFLVPPFHAHIGSVHSGLGDNTRWSPDSDPGSPRLRPLTPAARALQCLWPFHQTQPHDSDSNQGEVVRHESQTMPVESLEYFKPKSILISGRWEKARGLGRGHRGRPEQVLGRAGERPLE